VCWGIRNQAFRTLKIKECFSRSDSRAKGPAAKPQEPLNPFSFFRIRLSACTLRRQQGCQMSSERPRALAFSIRLIVFSRDETREANLAHPGSIGLGFVRGVSSSLTPNIFKFECDSMFQVTKGARRKGSLQKIEGLLPTGARDDNKKGAVICGMTHEASITWRPNWRFPRSSLAHSV
jgi:hypothetical protein